MSARSQIKSIAPRALWLLDDPDAEIEGNNALNGLSACITFGVSAAGVSVVGFSNASSAEAVINALKDAPERLKKSRDPDAPALAKLVERRLEMARAHVAAA